MATHTPITVAHGDGIGPEIMAATLHILEAAGALLDRMVGLGLEIAMTENLRNYDGKPGFTLAQGQ